MGYGKASLPTECAAKRQLKFPIKHLLIDFFYISVQRRGLSKLKDAWPMTKKLEKSQIPSE